MQTSRRQQSLGEKAGRAKAIENQSTPKLLNKVHTPFEYQNKSGTPSNKTKKITKRTPPNRSNEVSPRMRFLSPTMSSKSKQSNSKKKEGPKQLYTVEDLEGQNQNEHQSDEKQEDSKVSKRLNMENPHDNQQLITGYKAFEYEQDDDHHQNLQQLIDEGKNELDIIENLDSEEEEDKVQTELQSSKYPQNSSQSSKLSNSKNFAQSVKQNYNSKELDARHEGVKSRYSAEIQEDISFPSQILEVPRRSSPPKIKPIEDSNIIKSNENSDFMRKINRHSKQSSPDKMDSKIESSKGHQEIVSMLSNPNMLFNDASSIKYNSIDHQNMSNFSLSSIAGEMLKPRFDGLDGMCYDLISAFVGDKFPVFVFANKRICTIFLDFQLEINEEVLNALAERINQSISYSLQSLSQIDTTNTKDAIQKIKAKKTTFTLSENCHEKF